MISNSSTYSENEFFSYALPSSRKIVEPIFTLDHWGKAIRVDQVDQRQSQILPKKLYFDKKSNK